MIPAIVLLLLIQTPPAGAASAVKPLLAEQKWYQEAKEDEKVYEGVLEINPGSGKIGLPARFNSFRLVCLEDGVPVLRQLHTRGHDHLLSPFIAHNVKLTAKLVITEGRSELWPGKIEVLGLAPVGVIAEWKILARTPNPIASQVGARPTPAVYRSAKELAISMGLGDNETSATTRINSYFQPAKVDWSKHMVISIAAGGRSGFLGQIRITKLSFGEAGLEVQWKNDQQAAGGSRVGDTVLVGRHDGEIRFVQEGSGKPIVIPAVGQRDEPPTKDVPKK